MTRKSILIIIAVIIVSFIFMFTLYLNNSNPMKPSPSTDSGDLTSENHETDHQEQTKQIVMQVSLNDEEFKALESLSKAYESKHPDVKIRVENIAREEAYATFKKSSQLGEAADVMLFDNAWVHEFAALAYLSEVDDTLVSDIQTLLMAPMVSQMKWNGFLWGVPKDIDPYILAWNPDRFLAEQLEPPENAEQLLAIHQQLSNQENGNYGLYVDFQDPYAWISFLRMLAGSLDQQEIITQLKRFFYGDEQDVTDESAPLIVDPVSDHEQNPWELLNEGKIAMMIGRESAFRQYAEEHIRMMALPRHSVESGTDEWISGGWLRGQSYVVSAKSTVKQEAFAWIQSLLSMEAQLTLMKTGGALPATISVYETESLRNHPFYPEMMRSIDEGGVLPPEPELADKFNMFQQQIHELRNGQQTIDQFVTNVLELWSLSTQPDDVEPPIS